MKRCTKCLTEKSLDMFCKMSKAPDGLAYWCRECRSEARKKGRELSRDKELEYTKKWREKNKERVKEYSREYARLNQHRRRFWQSIRRKKMSLDLSEEDKQKIADMYWLAKDLEKVTGEEYHVDHIKPLSKGGLHHPDNLQILPADLNLKKGARYEEST